MILTGPFQLRTFHECIMISVCTCIKTSLPKSSEAVYIYTSIFSVIEHAVPLAGDVTSGFIVSFKM